MELERLSTDETAVFFGNADIPSCKSFTRTDGPQATLLESLTQVILPQIYKKLSGVAWVHLFSGTVLLQYHWLSIKYHTETKSVPSVLDALLLALSTIFKARVAVQTRSSGFEATELSGVLSTLKKHSRTIGCLWLTFDHEEDEDAGDFDPCETVLNFLLKRNGGGTGALRTLFPALRRLTWEGIRSLSMHHAIAILQARSAAMKKPKDKFSLALVDEPGVGFERFDCIDVQDTDTDIEYGHINGGHVTWIERRDNEVHG